MKLKVAAGAPDMAQSPAAHQEAILALIRRARSDNAVLLVLPGNCPHDIDMAAVREAADSMPVYPLTAQGLNAQALPLAEGLDFYCCCADTPATASSYYELEELAAGTSREKKAVVILAAPKGGVGHEVYSGQCVIARNGFILQSTEHGYALAELRFHKKDLKQPVEATVDSQPTTPWTPLPEMLPRLLRLQADALSHRMRADGQTHISLTQDNEADFLLALVAAEAAMKVLSLPRENIHVPVCSESLQPAAEALGVSQDNAQIGLRLGLTARALLGAEPSCYAINGGIPRSVVHLMLRSHAATNGNMALSNAIWSVLDSSRGHWQPIDFLLYFSMTYHFKEDILRRLLEDTFSDKYNKLDIQKISSDFFEQYKTPAAADEPFLFSTHPS